MNTHQKIEVAGLIVTLATVMIVGGRYQKTIEDNTRDIAALSARVRLLDDKLDRDEVKIAVFRTVLQQEYHIRIDAKVRTKMVPVALKLKP